MFDASTIENAPPVTPHPSADDRTWGAVAHLAALIPIPGPNVLVPLIVWLARRDESDFLDEQGKESVNFQLSILLLVLATLPLMLIGVGFVILAILPVINTLLVLWAALQVSQGENYRYPFNLRFLG